MLELQTQRNIVCLLLTVSCTETTRIYVKNIRKTSLGQIVLLFALSCFPRNVWRAAGTSLFRKKGCSILTTSWKRSLAYAPWWRTRRSDGEASWNRTKVSGSPSPKETGPEWDGLACWCNWSKQRKGALLRYVFYKNSFEFICLTLVVLFRVTTRYWKYWIVK